MLLIYTLIAIYKLFFQIWIDDVNCKGNETTLLLCEKVAWGKSNCRHFEDAGIICKGIARVSTESLKFNNYTS